MYPELPLALTSVPFPMSISTTCVWPVKKSTLKFGFDLKIKSANNRSEQPCELVYFPRHLGHWCRRRVRWEILWSSHDLNCDSQVVKWINIKNLPLIQSISSCIYQSQHQLEELWIQISLWHRRQHHVLRALLQRLHDLKYKKIKSQSFARV